MTERHYWQAAVACCTLLFALQTGADNASYLQELDDWKAERLAFLKGKDGYLNLVGLYWLGKPVSTFGSSSTADLVFPASAPGIIGAFQQNGGQVLLSVADGIEVMHGTTPVRQIMMQDDLSGTPVVVTSGSLAWTVINREQNFAVRLRDFENPAIAAFAPIEYFPVDSDFRVSAQLDPYDTPRQVRITTVIAGLDYKPQSPGVVRFELDGAKHALEAYSIYGGLMFVFGDKTTGRQTYPAGRFLYTGLPDDDGRITLDFNKAENPPCAFNEFATCPVASPRNRLAVSIPAGEKYDPRSH